LERLAERKNILKDLLFRVVSLENTVIINLIYVTIN